MAVKTEFLITAKDDTKPAIDSAKGGFKALGAEAREFANQAVIGLGAAGAAAVAAGVALYNQAAQAADALAKQADKVGEATQEIQAFQAAASLSGIETEKANASLTKMVKNIGDAADGSGPAADALARLGLNAQELASLPPVQAYEVLMDDLQQVESQTQRVQIATEIFGKTGADMLNMTGDSVRAAREEMYALGLQITRVDAAKIEEANDAIDRAKMAASGFGNQLAIQFSPIVSALTEEFINAVKEAGGFGQVATEVFNATIQGAAYAANVIHGLAAVWDGMKVVVVGAMEWALRYFETIETGIRTVLDYIPGVEVSTESAIGNVRKSFTATREQFVTDFQNTLNEPMPYDGIVKWAEEATIAATERAGQVAKDKASQIGNDFGSGGIASAAGSREDKSEVEYMAFDPTTDPEVVLAQERIAYLRTLKDAQLASDAESEELAYLNRMEMLRARFEEGELVTLESYNRLKEGVEKQHQDNLKAINNAGYAQRAAFDKKNLADQSKQVFGTLSNITAGVAQHNKGLFELNKAAGIATAIINTYKGVSESLAAYPMPLAAVMAAAHLAAGLAQVSSIKSQSFGSQSAGATSVGTAPVTTAPSNYTDTSTGTSATQAPAEKRPDIYINIEASAQYSGSSVRDLMERMSDELGYNVRFGT